MTFISIFIGFNALSTSEQRGSANYHPIRSQNQWEMNRLCKGINLVFISVVMLLKAIDKPTHTNTHPSTNDDKRSTKHN